MSLRDWFLAPAPTPRRAPPEPGEDGASEPSPPARDATARPSPPGSTAAWAPPVGAAPAHHAPPGIGSPVATPAGDSPAPFAAAWAPPVGAAPAHHAPPGVGSPVATPAGDSPAPFAAAWVPPVDAAPARAAPVDTSPDHTAARSVASAAVIGRPGEAEPVAAGVALALRGRASAAAVIVVGERGVPHADGGTRAARRLAARLDAHGFGVAARGRLAWAYVTPAAARRAARVAGEPVVLAITAPLDLALELAISDQALAIVVARDEHGPLAQLATASLACRDVTTTEPLPRGISRLLARQGLRAPAEVRGVLHRSNVIRR